MQQKNFAENFFTDIQSTLKTMINAAPAGYPFDLKTMMETQRKNMQAMAEANQCAIQGWQAMAQRQTEMVSEFVQGNSSMARQTFAEGGPQDKIAAQADILKSSYEQTLANTQELAELMQKCTADTADVINKRVLASIGEIKNSAKKAEKAAK